ncbi:hypothetical protein AMS68_007148 [Peltaster fructicola]|uniref:Nin one binding (NOB1) Zn-ribbon-like domain-containing protein n=1 Tax=Peltaster fructicola TaxID=286661 RepID=A0A6H0Y3Y3_9PEZI|nr:hypothetical protein AMS68_007148 [Peltaster fructicola]
MPGQKKLNGSPPAKIADANQEQGTQTSNPVEQTTSITTAPKDDPTQTTARLDEHNGPLHDFKAPPPVTPNDPDSQTEVAGQAPSHEPVAEDGSCLVATEASHDDADQEEEDSDSDSDGWITPANLKRQQAKDSGASAVDNPEPSTMQAAVLTSDFAMQNVILQMNLNLLSASLQRVRHLKTYVLRCHACFQTTKDMNKQFCPRCGQAALTRVACSTNANGEFKLHLKKNMQWNTRGDRFSVPKPAHGSANGRVKGGGKGGWGHDLILAEDQKEYERARVVEKKQKERSLMDEDYLPSILTGDRSRGNGRIKVGAGRNVNSRKR